MPEENHSTFRNNGPVPERKPEYPGCRDTLRRCLLPLARSIVLPGVTISLLGAAVLLLCQCHRQSSTDAPTPSPTPASTAIAAPSPTMPTVPSTAVPTSTPAQTPGLATSSPALLSPTASPTPDPFAEGIKRLLQTSGKGFLELRGKFIKTENGSGPEPLFRVRKLYAGTFLLAGATSAELEEVYFSTAQQPAYNYHLYYQALSVRDSIQRYDDLRLNLNRVLEGFEHTFGDRYDAWARNDPLRTAILLSCQDVAGSPEIQVHVSFSSPQW
jgi:hypothetical protein